MDTSQPLRGRAWVATGAILGAAGVLLGAFGAHGLPAWLAERGLDAAESARRLATFETAARYQMVTALALLYTGLAMRHAPGAAWRVAAVLLTLGALIFCGLCYALALAGPDWRWLGAVVPVGGLSMAAGWGAIAYAALAERGGNTP